MVRTQIADQPRVWPPNPGPPEVIGVGDGITTAFFLTYPNVIAGTLTLFLGTLSEPAGGPATTVFTGIPASAYTVGGTPPVGTTGPTGSLISFVPVATTIAAPINGPNVITVTPASMLNITVGQTLLIDTGSAAEAVAVSSVTGTTFTATFLNPHQALATVSSAPAVGTIIAARYQATAFSDAELLAYLTRAGTLYTDDLNTLKRVQYDLIDVLLADREKQKRVRYGDFDEDGSQYARSLLQLKESLRKDLAGGPTPGAQSPIFNFGSNPILPYGPRR